MNSREIYQILATFLVAISCAQQITADCPSLSNCKLECQYGLAYDENECNICQCHDPCKYVTCLANETCTPVQLQCIRAPCPPLGMCVPKPTTCPSMATCTLNCQYGLAYDENECNICQCHEPCKYTNCSANEECTVVQLQCFRAPCPPLGMCTPKPTSSPAQSTTPYHTCPNLNCRPEDCQYGFEMDAIGCYTCTCHDPCKNLNCTTNELCTVTEVQCIRAPCYPIGSCTAKPAGCPEMLPEMRDCQLAGPCTYGLEQDQNGCEKCRCLEPCKNVSCPVGQECQVVWPTCLEGVQCPQAAGMCTLSSMPVQATTPYHTCPNSNCQPGDCQYGFQMNEFGCYTCTCHEPCKNVSCPWGQECQVVWPMCLAGTNCQPSGFCTPSSSSAIPIGSTPSFYVSTTPPYGSSPMRQSVTPLICPNMNCEPGSCIFGYDTDSRGCVTCTCYDPCKTYYCPEGQKCVASPPDCAGDPMCSNGPIRQCVDDVPIERFTPSATQLLSCCASQAVTENCQFLCVPDFNVTVQNVGTVLQCLQYMPTYLTCAGGVGDSYNTCCRANGASAACSILCSAADVTMDVTYQQKFTECLLSDYINDALQCVQSGQPDVVPTGRSTRMIISSTNGMLPAICLQPREVGPCKAYMEHWFYNTETGNCESFVYGGCYGNDNRFESFSACQAACLGSRTTTPTIHPCPEIMCRIGCTRQVGYDGCFTCVCGDITTPQTTTPAIMCTEMMCLQTCRRIIGSYGCTIGCDCSSTTTEEPPHCPEPMCALGCTRSIGEDGCSKCVCDSQCPAIGCSRQCQYGVQKDANGCVTCDCIDPCISVTCPTGYVCTYKQEPVCEHDICQVSYRGQCTAATVGCPTMNCTNTCPYGRVRNQNKCETCQCADPCQDVSCEMGKYCKITSALACVSDTCEMRHVGLCAVECHPYPCPSSNTTCEYGYVKDNNDCDTCDCLDPCKDVTCKPDEVCVRKTIPTYVGDDSDVKQIYIGQCEPQITCSRPLCEMLCPYGFQRDANGCEFCQCFEPCMNLTCTEGSICSAVPILATREYPYSYIGRCVENTGCPGVMCMMQCDYGFVKDSNGCDVCKCYKPCQNVTCSDSISICQPRRVEASSIQPYEYIGECIQCTGMTCRLSNCQYGLLQVTPTCSLCECFDPCKTKNCSSTQTCLVIPVTDAPVNPYMAECVSKCPALTGCRICQYGYQLDDNGCETCACYNPCEVVDCRNGMICQPVPDPTCTTQNCRYMPSCIPQLGECANEMQQNLKRYAINLSEMPELNCDMAGYYKPMQCENDAENCYCTDPNGQGGNMKLSLPEAVDVCFPADRILGTMRIEANFSLLAPGSGPVFKQVISKQLGDVMLLDDSKVTVTEYYSGSIMVDFVAADLNPSIISNAENILTDLSMSNQILHMNYSGGVYRAQILNFRRFTSVVSTTTPKSTTPRWVDKNGLSRAGFLVLVILLPIVGALFILGILILCCYKIYNSRGSFEPMSNRSSMSFDNALEKGTHTQKSGYDNPNFKKEPLPQQSETVENVYMM